MNELAELQVSFRKHLDTFTKQAERISGGSVGALHRTRIASRRLRELVPVLGLDPDTTRALARRLKKLTKQLGAVRELDVLTSTLEEFVRDAGIASIAAAQMQSLM